MPSKDNAKRYSCCKCDKTDVSSKHFYKTSNGLYANVGYLPMCRDCMMDTFNRYARDYDDMRKAMKRICMLFDLYYDDKLFLSNVKGDEFSMGLYMRSLNMTQHNGKTFDTNLDEGFRFGNYNRKSKYTNITSGEVSSEDINTWGDGFEPIDYDNLNDHYDFLKNANPNCDSNQEIFIKDLCYIKMQQMKSLRECKPDDYGKMVDQYRKTFTQAGLKTVRDSSTDESFTMGVNIETIEKYTPAEYYKNKSLYKDFDNIGDYITRFLLRPLRNLMHGTTDRDHEFYVKDEEDVNEYGEE